MSGLPYSDVPYREMWDRVAAEFRERNGIRHLRDSALAPATLRSIVEFWTSGKPEYSKVIWFEGRAVSDAFFAAVLAALDRYLARESAA